MAACFSKAFSLSQSALSDQKCGDDVEGLAYATGGHGMTMTRGHSGQAMVLQDGQLLSQVSATLLDYLAMIKTSSQVNLNYDV